jgi:hypothetical protein
MRPPASQHQTSTFWGNNMNAAQELRFHQQDIQNSFYLGSTDDINMEFSGAATMETPVYSLPMMWTSAQLQSEHQIFCSHVGQVAANNECYQTYIMDNHHPNWASTVSIPSSVALLANNC